MYLRYILKSKLPIYTKNNFLSFCRVRWHALPYIIPGMTESLAAGSRRNQNSQLPWPASSEITVLTKHERRRFRIKDRYGPQKRILDESAYPFVLLGSIVVPSSRSFKIHRKSYVSFFIHNIHRVQGARNRLNNS